MAAEDIAKARHMHIRIVPTPGKIYASCGFSLKYPLEEEQELTNMLLENELSWDGLYHAAQEGLAVTYEKVKER
ncbi:MAG: DUF3343 domain-containing protein [Megasphaera sp.]|nr:DUF3343 domain-containing protein [Megasphaera sp.]MCH4187704.1 DUF3343 domain-containing protein [Megasphaera sp.]MCH4217603.1 DUF3343 domain-containing protein [Megasphaera sp.]